jgi:hypothetical protein
MTLTGPRGLTDEHLEKSLIRVRILERRIVVKHLFFSFWVENCSKLSGIERKLGAFCV